MDLLRLKFLRVQNKFKRDNNIEISLVSRDNFLLFTPMLLEVASGMIETRHIVTPLRTFCKKTKLYEANVESIDLENKRVIVANNPSTIPPLCKEHLRVAIQTVCIYATVT